MNALLGRGEGRHSSPKRSRLLVEIRLHKMTPSEAKNGYTCASYTTVRSVRGGDEECCSEQQQECGLNNRVKVSRGFFQCNIQLFRGMLKNIH